MSPATDESLKNGDEDRGNEQRHAQELSPVKARQGVVSGRVLAVPAARLVILALACAWIRFFNARL